MKLGAPPPEGEMRLCAPLLPPPVVSSSSPKRKDLRSHARAARPRTLGLWMVYIIQSQEGNTPLACAARRRCRQGRVVELRADADVSCPTDEKSTLEKDERCPGGWSCMTWEGGQGQGGERWSSGDVNIAMPRSKQQFVPAPSSSSDPGHRPLP